MILEISSECLLFGINPDRFQTGLLQIDIYLPHSKPYRSIANIIIDSSGSYQARDVHGSDGPADRAGSGRVGSCRAGSKKSDPWTTLYQTHELTEL